MQQSGRFGFFLIHTGHMTGNDPRAGRRHLAVIPEVGNTGDGSVSAEDGERETKTLEHPESQEPYGLDDGRHMARFRIDSGICLPDELGGKDTSFWIKRANASIEIFSASISWITSESTSGKEGKESRLSSFRDKSSRSKTKASTGKKENRPEPE